MRRARVRRNATLVEIDAEAIVRDDLVALAPGDRVPVDGPLVEGRGLEVDESLVTGESDSVPKRPGEVPFSSARKWSALSLVGCPTRAPPGSGSPAHSRRSRSS